MTTANLFSESSPATLKTAEPGLRLGMKTLPSKKWKIKDYDHGLFGLDDFIDLKQFLVLDFLPCSFSTLVQVMKSNAEASKCQKRTAQEISLHKGCG
jgi:hypothetical protein